MIKTRIISTGASVPEQVITNDDLSKIVDTSDEWITQRTGIKKRHISGGENTSHFAINTARQVLERAEVVAEDVDLIIVASVTADYGTPSLACMVQKEIGAVNAVAFDVNAACSGFMFALSIADKYIKTGMYENAIVIGAETLSKIVDWKDRATCVLFGDGSGGAYVEKSEDMGILEEELGAKGELWNILKSIERVMDNAGVKADEIKYVVPHQANARIVDIISRKLGIAHDKCYMNMSEYGNTSSASIPIVLNELNEKGLIERGDKLLLTGFGGGMTWGTMLISW